MGNIRPKKVQTQSILDDNPNAHTLEYTEREDDPPRAPFDPDYLRHTIREDDPPREDILELYNAGAKPKQTDREVLQEAELMADPRVMMSSPLSASEIVASIKSGNPVGLEHMTLGSTSTGDPAAVYIDDFGQVQHHVLSTSQWMAMKESRSLNRSRVAQQEEKTRKLNEQREELSGAFKNGIDKVDNEAFRALLKQRFQDDPQGAMKMLIDDQRGDQRDAEANAKVQAAAIQAQAWSISSALQNDNFKELEGAKKSIATAQQNAITSKGDSSAVMAGINGQRRNLAIRERASAYTPTPQTIGMSPTQAMGPTQVQGMLAAWLAIPEVDRLVPHPSSPDYASAMEDVLASLNGVATSLGWQQTFTIEDMGRIEQAVMTHRNVHNEAFEIKQLTRDNDLLQKQIDELTAQNIDVSTLQTESAALRTEIDQMRSDYDTKRGKDTDGDGVVTAQEEAAFTEGVSTLDTKRELRDQALAAAAAERAATAATTKRDSQKDALQDANALNKLQSDMEELLEGDSDGGSINELRAIRDNATARGRTLNAAQQEILDRKETAYYKLQKQWRERSWSEQEKLNFLATWETHITKVLGRDVDKFMESDDAEAIKIQNQITNFEDAPPPPAPTP